MANDGIKVTTSFDFDSWVELAKSDPEKFEQKRKEAVNELIESVPEPMQQRLNGLQWRIDMDVRRSSNTMDACLRIYKMMMDSVYSPGGLFEALNALLENGETVPDLKKASNDVVVDFSKKLSSKR